MKRLFIACHSRPRHPRGRAGKYPDKPVRFIVPFPPGGGTDALARILGAKLGELWGQQVIVDNRAGAQGNIGTAAGAKAAPDGYTITFAHQGALVINPHLYKDTGYDTLQGLRRGGAHHRDGVHRGRASVGAGENLKELAQYARQNPGKLTFASTSAGPHIVGELFKLTTKTDLRARAVQGRRAGDQRPARRPGDADVLQPDLDRAAREERQAARARRHGQQAQPRAARRADRARVRASRSCPT